MLELAAHIVETKSGHFNPEEFEDHYEDALKDLLKKKQAGEKIEAPKERAPAKVMMDALRRSVETERGGRPTCVRSSTVPLATVDDIKAKAAADAVGRARPADKPQAEIKALRAEEQAAETPKQHHG
jgi:DNA end-binding protein Ku